MVSSYLWLPKRVHYHITEQYHFSLKGDDDYLYLGVLIPKSGPYQTIENIEISWTGSHERESDNNLDIIKLSGELKRGDISEAVIEYDVILPQGIISWEAPVEDFHNLP